MNKLVICAGAFLFTASTSMAQTTKAKTKTVAKPTVATDKVVMKSLNDSFSYAAGLNIAANMKDQGITNINGALMAKAINDVFGNKPTALNPELANATLQKQLGIYNEQKGAENAKKAAAEAAKGKAFLDANKSRPGVISLPSGLQYEIVKAGDPAGIKPTLQDTVVINYAGKLIDGTEFDASKNGPITYPITGFIKGWTDVLQLMTKGAHWKVYIPSELGYGDRGSGPLIGPGATLIFDITLEDIKSPSGK